MIKLLDLLNIVNRQQIRIVLQGLFNNKTPVFVTASFIIIIRLIADLIFYFLNTQPSLPYLFFQIFSSVFPVILFFVYFIPNYYLDESAVPQNNNEYFSSLKYLTSILSINLFLSFISFSPKLNSSFIVKLWSLLLIDLITPFLLLITLFSAIFIYKWLRVFKHQNTEKQIFIVRISTLLLLFITLINILSFPEYQHSFSPGTLFSSVISAINSLNKGIQNIIELSLYFLIIFNSFLVNAKTAWIRKLNKSKKYELLFLSLCITIINLIIFFQTKPQNSVILFPNHFATTSHSLIFNLYYNYLAASVKFVNIISVINIAYHSKTILSAIRFLPNTDYLVKINDRLARLTQLNNIVLFSNNVDDLLQKVSEFSLQISGGSACWIEISEVKKKNSLPFFAFQNVTEQDIIQVRRDTNLQILLQQISSAKVVNTLEKEQELKLIQKTFPFVRSLTLIPIHDSKKRLGSLVILHNNEYPLEAEDLDILNAFAYNIGLAVEQNFLQEQSLENDRYKNELALAEQMQIKLLPHFIPEIDNLKIEAFSIPAQEVGGDYYDFFTLKNGHTCLIIGDVSGKGISAAFIMAQVKGIALATAPNSNSVEEFITNINTAFYSSLDRKTFITITAIEFLPDEAHSSEVKIRCIRAGHTPIVQYTCSNLEQNTEENTKNTIKYITHVPKGFGIGIVGQDTFAQNLEVLSLELKTQEYIFIFTDGLNEMRWKTNQEIGFEGLYNFVGEYLISQNNLNDGSLSSNQETQSLGFKQYLLEAIRKEKYKVLDDLSVIILKVKK